MPGPLSSFLNLCHSYYYSTLSISGNKERLVFQFLGDGVQSLSLETRWCSWRECVQSEVLYLFWLQVNDFLARTSEMKSAYLAGYCANLRADCFSRGPGFSFQHPLGSSQTLQLPQFQGIRCPLLTLLVPGHTQIHGHTCRQNTYT